MFYAPVAVVRSLCSKRLGVFKMLTILAMFACTFLIIGGLGGKEAFMKTLGAVFLTILVGVIVLGVVVGKP